MKIAVTYENGQIFQHFGHTKEFKVYDCRDGRVESARVENAGVTGDADRAVEELLAGTLRYSAGANCDHHSHGEGGHCGHHGEHDGCHGGSCHG